MVTCGCYDIDAVNFVPTARLVVATNTLPPVDDSSDGFWLPAIVIPHNVKIPEAEQDKQLADKIIHGELRGVLHWALWGLARLKEQGRFTSARRSEKAREQYRRDNDPIGTFLQEEVVKHVFFEDLQQAFIAWKGTTSVAEQLDLRRIVRIYPDVVKRQKRVDGKLRWRYVGISLKNK